MSRPALSGVRHEIACQTHRNYWLTCEDYDALWEYAGGRCQICGVTGPETDRGKLCIDHLHGYGDHMVRGLLCDPCNVLMAKVDGRKVEHTTATQKYCYRAWFARALMEGRGHWYNPLQRRWEFADSKSYREVETA